MFSKVRKVFGFKLLKMEWSLALCLLLASSDRLDFLISDEIF